MSETDELMERLERIEKHLQKSTAGPWFTLKEGASYVRRSYSRFLAAMHNREFPVYPVPGTETQQRPDYRVHRDDLDKWLKQGSLRDSKK